MSTVCQSLQLCFSMSSMMTIVMDDRMSYSLRYMLNATDSNMEDINSFLENTANVSIRLLNCNYTKTNSTKTLFSRIGPIPLMLTLFGKSPS